jgi:branched-chain amino acid transport system ATP-binding protein
VRENIAVAAETRRGWARDGANTAQTVEEVIDRVGLRASADERVDSLPTGSARLVELGRALACRPSVLLLDEPASGQTEAETERFGALLRELCGEGITVVLVEHDVQLVMAVCDTIHVLDFGRIIASGPPEEVRTNEAVLAAYLGTKKATA